MQFHPPTHETGQAVVVGDHYEGHIEFTVQFRQEFTGALSGRFVKVSGGFICQENLGSHQYRPRDGGPLPFSAGQGSYPVMQPLFKP